MLVGKPGARILDVGCGPRRDPRATDGIDFYPYPEVTVVHNAIDFPWPIPDASFDGVVSHQLLEHLPLQGVAGEDPFFAFFDQIWRVLKPGGFFEFDVPHLEGPSAAADPTHRRFYSERAFSHLWDTKRDPLYPRRHWELVEMRTDRWYSVGGRVNAWHVRQRAPRLHRLACRLGFGVPDQIYGTLQRPGTGSLCERLTVPLPSPASQLPAAVVPQRSAMVVAPGLPRAPVGGAAAPESFASLLER